MSADITKTEKDDLKTIGFSIIPAIDIIDGKCVRLTHGDYAQKKCITKTRWK